MARRKYVVYRGGILVFVRNIGCGGERGVEGVLSAGGYRKPTTVSVEVPGASPSLVYSNHVQILVNIKILSRRDVTQLSPSRTGYTASDKNVVRLQMAA